MLNASDPDALKMFYQDILKQYNFENKRWKKRKNKRFATNKVYSVSLKNEKIFALRLSLISSSGPKSLTSGQTILPSKLKDESFRIQSPDALIDLAIQNFPLFCLKFVYIRLGSARKTPTEGNAHASPGLKCEQMALTFQLQNTKSFNDLRTIFGNVYETFKGTAVTRIFFSSDSQFHVAFKEANFHEMPPGTARSVFLPVCILVNQMMPNLYTKQ